MFWGRKLHGFCGFIKLTVSTWKIIMWKIDVKHGIVNVKVIKTFSLEHYSSDLKTMLCITLPSVDQILTRLSKDPVASQVPLSLSLATTKLVIPASWAFSILYWYMYVCMYVCTYVHMYVRMYVRTYACKYVRTYVCMYVRTYIHMYVCMYVYTYVRTYVCMYVRTYVRMYVCTYVRTYIHTYVCMYVYMYVCSYVCMHVAIYFIQYTVLTFTTMPWYSSLWEPATVQM